MTTLGVVDLGRRSYGPVLELQRVLCRRRIAGELSRDLLLLVEHDPVITLGRGTRSASLPIPPAALTARGLEVFEVERGGDVTLHAPGQLVGYPILDLRAHRPDLHWYLRQVEETLIRALGGLGISAARSAGRTGVWTAPAPGTSEGGGRGEGDRRPGRKIASIGIHVKQWVTFHGFALNVTTDLSLFDLIIPCGLTGVTMTSVARERELVKGGGGDAGTSGDRDPAALWAATREAVVAAFGEVFRRVPVPEAEEDLTEPWEGERARPSA